MITNVVLNRVLSATTFRKSLDQRNTPSTGIGGTIEPRPPVGADHMMRICAETLFATDMFEDAYNAKSRQQSGDGAASCRG